MGTASAESILAKHRPKKTKERQNHLFRGHKRLLSDDRHRELPTVNRHARSRYWRRQHWLCSCCLLTTDIVREMTDRLLERWPLTAVSSKWPECTKLSTHNGYDSRVLRAMRLRGAIRATALGAGETPNSVSKMLKGDRFRSKNPIHRRDRSYVADILSSS